eukprot:1833939-Prymnesium_polylepis.3
MATSTAPRRPLQILACPDSGYAGHRAGSAVGETSRTDTSEAQDARCSLRTQTESVASPSLLCRGV